MPYSLINRSNYVNLKYGPLSDIKTLGKPYLANSPLKALHVSVVAEVDGIPISGYLTYASTTTKNIRPSKDQHNRYESFHIAFSPESLGVLLPLMDLDELFDLATIYNFLL